MGKTTIIVAVLAISGCVAPMQDEGTTRESVDGPKADGGRCVTDEPCGAGRCVDGRCQYNVRACQLELETIRSVSVDCNAGAQSCTHVIEGDILVDPELLGEGFAPEARIYPSVAPLSEEHEVWVAATALETESRGFGVFRFSWEGPLEQADDRADVRLRVRRGDEILEAYGLDGTQIFDGERSFGTAYTCDAPRSYANRLGVTWEGTLWEEVDTRWAPVVVPADAADAVLHLELERGQPDEYPITSLYHRVAGAESVTFEAVYPEIAEELFELGYYRVPVDELLPAECGAQVQLYVHVAGQNDAVFPERDFFVLERGCAAESSADDA